MLNIIVIILIIFYKPMHPDDSIFGGIKLIDYRNGRYQGLFDSSAKKRHGIGILIDDDLNFYCSEW